MYPPIVLELAFLIAHSALACDKPATASEIQRVAAEARDATLMVDAEAFLLASDSLRDRLPCLDEPIPGAVAAQVHRAQGLRAFSDRETPRVGAALAASKALEPWFSPSDELMPEGHPLRSLYEGAVSNGVSQPLPAVATGELFVDGAPSVDRPVDRAYVFQWVDGEVMLSAYQWPEQALPSYPVAPPRRHTHLYIGGALGLGSGVLYASAAWTRLRYADSALSDRASLARTTNGLALVSAALAAGAVTVVVVGW